MKLKKWMPLFCLETGVVLGIIRGIDLGRGYEAETQLAVEHHPLLWVIVVLCIFFAVGIVLVGRKVKSSRQLDFVQCFRCVHSGYKTVGVVCAVLLLAGGALGIYLYFLHMEDLIDFYLNLGIDNTVYIHLRSIPHMVMWGLTLATGVSLIGILSMQAKIEVTPKNSYWLIVPMVWSAFLLISCYLDFASVPSISLIAFFVLTCVSMMLAFRDFGCFVYKGKLPINRFLITSSCAATLCLMEVISRAWNLLLQGNSIEMSGLLLTETGVMAMGCLFLFCNQYILLSNLEYQESISRESGPETPAPETLPEEEEGRAETAGETAAAPEEPAGPDNQEEE